MRCALLAAALASLLLWPLPARAETVDLELVLASGGGGAADDSAMALQREGYAEALRSPAVLGAIAAGFNGKIAVTFVEWGGPASQQTIVDWMVIGDKASAKTFAKRLLKAPRQPADGNAIGAAIGYAANLIRTNAYDAKRRVIDIAGGALDEDDNTVRQARDAAVRDGITINALVVQPHGSGHPGQDDDSLAWQYRARVIGGGGAFVVAAEDRAQFAKTILQKLVREIAAADDRNRLARTP